jgi:hypothetical protein
VLSDDEIRLFWPGIVQSPVSRRVGLALQLILLSGVRSGEAAGIARAELEFIGENGQARWVIPVDRSKNRRAHLVPLFQSGATNDHLGAMGPKVPASTVMNIEEEAINCAFRKHNLLPRDDCLYALQATIPHLTPSLLHRCLPRHGISRLPENEGEKSSKKKFKTYPVGFFHIDIARSGQNKANFTSSSPSIVPLSSPSPDCLRKPILRPQPPSLMLGRVRSLQDQCC